MVPRGVLLRGIIGLLLLMMVFPSCSRKSRYRVLLINETHRDLQISLLFYKGDVAKEGGAFDEHFATGERHDMDADARIIISWSTVSGFDRFWLGARDQEGGTRVIEAPFESYERPWSDISDGLRVDYILEEAGTFRKRYF